MKEKGVSVGASNQPLPEIDEVNRLDTHYVYQGEQTILIQLV